MAEVQACEKGGGRENAKDGESLLIVETTSRQDGYREEHDGSNARRSTRRSREVTRLNEKKKKNEIKLHK